MAEFDYEIIRKIGVISESRNGWMKELNLISWNKRKPVYDVRDWSPEHDKMGKGATLNKTDARRLVELLTEELERGKGNES